MVDRENDDCVGCEVEVEGAVQDLHQTVKPDHAVVQDRVTDVAVAFY